LSGGAKGPACPMNRRSFLVSASALAAWVLLSGHSPYRKFHIFRKTRLIIMAPNDDKRAGVVADAVVAFFSIHWGDSRPSSGRAQTAPEVVKLLVSNQLDVAVLSQKDAMAAREGHGRFANLGPSALCALAVFKDHILVAREDLLKPIAEKITQPLQANWATLDRDLSGAVESPYVGQAIGIPLHSVAADMYQRSAVTKEPAS
jgi:hypothetical protein